MRDGTAWGRDSHMFCGVDECMVVVNLVAIS